ncbi:MAG: ribonuclease, partial [Terracidiphilus sp.]
MAKEICISSTPHETRLAILEDDQLAEIYYERENEYTLAGSIYNGRVTRVLPGMQSAFVDIGLERDAFLYVTDFLELEDQEESDELEKAAASNPNQPPREVHHGGDRNEQRPAPRPDGRQSDGRQDQPRQDRSGRDRRPPIESAPLSAEAEFSAPQSLIISEQHQESGQESSDEQGAKRWRGRRRRRGGRGPSGGPEGAPESAKSDPVANGFPEPVAAQEVRPASQPTPRAERAPAPFVLPGESLSRYGGVPADSEQKSAPPPLPPARTLPSSRPSTLIEAPLAWDGSGLLPGESLSKHRARQPEPESERAPQPNESLDAADLIEEESFVEEMTEFPSEFVEPVAPEAVQGLLSSGAMEDDTIEVVEEQLADVPHSEQASIEYESTELTSDAPEFSDP